MPSPFVSCIAIVVEIKIECNSSVIRMYGRHEQRRRVILGKGRTFRYAHHRSGRRPVYHPSHRVWCYVQRRKAHQCRHLPWRADRHMGCRCVPGVEPQVCRVVSFGLQGDPGDAVAFHLEGEQSVRGRELPDAIPCWTHDLCLAWGPGIQLYGDRPSHRSSWHERVP